MASSNRTRIWVCVGYPESLPSDWRERLAETCVPCIVSPLHDKDVNADGETKKPHYHFILMFAGVKSPAQVDEICSSFGGVNPQPCSNLQGYARYLIHKDNPEKFQYNPELIECFGGADWSSIIRTSQDRYNTLRDIMSFCRNKNMSYYSDLLDYCRENNREWFEVCCDNTIVLRAYCISLHTKMAELSTTPRKAF